MKRTTTHIPPVGSKLWLKHFMKALQHDGFTVRFRSAESYQYYPPAYRERIELARIMAEARNNEVKRAA